MLFPSCSEAPTSVMLGVCSLSNGEMADLSGGFGVTPG